MFNGQTVVKIELVTEDGGVDVQPQFIVTFDDKKSMAVPADKENRHYFDVKAWYNAQTKKPFKFDFEA